MYMTALGILAKQKQANTNTPTNCSPHCPIGNGQCHLLDNLQIHIKSVPLQTLTHIVFKNVHFVFQPTVSILPGLLNNAESLCFTNQWHVRAFRYNE
jgi:hypothetical protein